MTDIIEPPTVPIVDDDKTITMVAETTQNQIELLEKSCTPLQVTNVIIHQINGLQNDIKDLELFKDGLKAIFPSDPRSYRSSFVIENKVKTFTGFYATILAYKKELNDMLLKLRAILDVGTDLEKYKEAIREVIIERGNATLANEDNKKRMEELLKKNPNLMPTSL